MLELEVGVTAVATNGVDAVLGAGDLLELGANLVTALGSLDVEDLPHLLLLVVLRWWRGEGGEEEEDLGMDEGVGKG